MSFTDDGWHHPNDGYVAPNGDAADIVDGGSVDVGGFDGFDGAESVVPDVFDSAAADSGIVAELEQRFAARNVLGDDGDDGGGVGGGVSAGGEDVGVVAAAASAAAAGRAGRKNERQQAKSAQKQAKREAKAAARRARKRRSRRGDVWDDLKELEKGSLTEPDAAAAGGDSNRSEHGETVEGSADSAANGNDTDTAAAADRDTADSVVSEVSSTKRRGRKKRGRRTNKKGTQLASQMDSPVDSDTEPAKTSKKPKKPKTGKAAKEPKKAAKEHQKSSKANRRAERQAENELRRRLKKLKTPKESRAARNAARQASQSDKSGDETAQTDDTGNKQTRNSKKSTKKQRTRKTVAHRGSPPKGTASVMVIDGGHVSLMLLRGGRVTAVSTETYEDPVSAIESVASLKRVDRLVWCNEIDAKVIAAAPTNLPNSREQALLRELHTAQSLIDAFGKRELLGTLDTTPELVRKPIGVGISDQWAKHRLLRKHAGRIVVPAQSHGTAAGVWLRVGWAWTEAAYTDNQGHTLDWSRVAGLKLPPKRVGKEDINVGSGVEALRAATERLGSDYGPEKWLNHIVDQVDRLVADWGRQIEPAETIWLHGPGTRSPGLEETVETRTRIRVQRPSVDLLDQATVDVDQLVTAVNAWSRAPLSNPNRVLAKARRRRLTRIVRRGSYVAAVLAALIAVSAWIGSNRSAAIAAAEQRKTAAEAQVAALQAETLPPPETLITGARDLLDCPNEVEMRSDGSVNDEDFDDEDDLGEPGTESDMNVVAVPVNYDPAVWPVGWQAAFMDIGTSLASPEVSRQVDASVLTAPQIEQAKQIAADSIAAIENDEPWDDTDVSDRFVAAGLNVDEWRLAAWARTWFNESLSYLPPRGSRICAAASKNMLWEAQNSALIPLLVAEQMNTQGGWIITKPDMKSDVILEQAHKTYHFKDMSVFVAWLANQPDMSKTLTPLAWVLWGERGVVRIDDPFKRRCDIGVHPQTGAPLRICGSDVSVQIGPSYLVEAVEVQ